MNEMKLVLKNEANRKEIEALEKKLYKGKATTGFNAKKYNGILKLNLKLKEDPLVIPKK